ncbi:MAG: translation initiation factor IF-2 [Dissulfurimicrobium sp.]|uniref:translation initiation factor IF-2 n=1 Tax=Dissulfurimicrobium sp. TaxID=2022436 RepID=UPI00404AA3AF
MTKIRVHELAKELGITNKEMELRLKEFGYRIKNYMSTLEDYEAREIRQKILVEQENAAAIQKKEAAPVIRRRHAIIRVKKLVTTATAEIQEQPSEPPTKTEDISDVHLSEDKTKIVAPKPEIVQEKTEAASHIVLKDHQAETETEPKEAADSSGAEEISSQSVAKPVTGVKKDEANGFAVQKTDTHTYTATEKEVEKPAPKSFVKILDRPRVVITKPAPSSTPLKPAQGPSSQRPAGDQRPQDQRQPQNQTADRSTRPSKSMLQSEMPSAVILEKNTKKKQQKRVLQILDMEDMAKRRKAGPKRQDKPKPLTKLLAEELNLVDTPGHIEPEIMTSAIKPLAPSKKKKGPRVKEIKKVVTTPPTKVGKRKLVIYETIQVGELAKRMGVKIGDVISRLIRLGVMVTANQTIDYETAMLVATEFDYEVEKKPVAEDIVYMEEAQVRGGELKLRPPVVTVMGHVDHGKTSLLDAIRHADVASREAGGITQHIGAYHVTLSSGHEVVFLDTPGHEAFTAMRARGAKVTDIVILVVAADDGVMAQTKEAIDHARAAGVPIIVAINKIDKPGANPERVKSELAELGLVPEEWGGDTIFVNISAKKRIGIEELLEMLALQSEVLELKADPNRPAKGHVIEAKLDKGRGPVATLLISDGTLHVGDAIVCGLYYGRIRAMINDKGEQIDSAGPSMPVEIQGLSGVPEAGNEFLVLPDEKKAREVAEYRQRKAREAEFAKIRKISLESVFDRLKENGLKELNIILKADVQGSLEALSTALRKLSTPEIKVNVVGSGIGAITESDVLLATASNAIIIGFNVRSSPQARALAEQEKVDIRFYDVIYNAIEEVKSAMTGLLEPVYEEKIIGRAEVRQTFHIPKVGIIAGCYVLEGMIQRNAKARLLRDNVVVYTGKIVSLRRFKEDAKEVQSGYECGIGLEKFNDIKTGDIIEAYKLEKRAAVLGEAISDIADDAREK